jgi:vacuolar-type H+-ATPase subunit I/STV1
VKHQPLEELLAELRAAIDENERGAANDAELARLAGRVEDRIRLQDDDGDLVEELREEVTRFEVTHPKLAAAIGRAADALSALGL